MHGWEMEALCSSLIQEKKKGYADGELLESENCVGIKISTLC